MEAPLIATYAPTVRPCSATRGSLPRTRKCAPLLHLLLLLGLTVFSTDVNTSVSKLLCSDFVASRLTCQPSISMIQEIAHGATEMNVPIYRTNRKLVATKNGRLENPSPLLFNPSWNREVPRAQDKRLQYPSISGALALGMAYQSVTDAHRRRPPIDVLGPDDSIPSPPRALIPP